jgi:hypothetical protein
MSHNLPVTNSLAADSQAEVYALRQEVHTLKSKLNLVQGQEQGSSHVSNKCSVSNSVSDNNKSCKSSMLNATHSCNHAEFKSNCDKKIPNGGSNRITKAKVICQFCNKVGHTAKTCFKIVNANNKSGTMQQRFNNSKNYQGSSNFSLSRRGRGNVRRHNRPQSLNSNVNNSLNPNASNFYPSDNLNRH